MARKAHKSRKAKRKQNQMPPLSFLDKLIYWLILILLCMAYLLLLLGTLYLRKKIAFSDQTVMATSDGASFLWFIVPWMTFVLMTFGPWVNAFQERKPIFGRKNFKYGPPAWPKVYPLFMKNKPYVWVSEKKQKLRKQIAVILLVVVLICFIPFPLSLYGRACLCSNGSVVEYNMFNKQVHKFGTEEITDVEIETYWNRGGRRSITRNWGIQMVVKTDSGQKYVFKCGDFRDDINAERLETMLSVKACYNSAVIHYSGVEDLAYVITDLNLNQDEIAMLYELFGRQNETLQVRSW